MVSRMARMLCPGDVDAKVARMALLSSNHAQVQAVGRWKTLCFYKDLQGVVQLPPGNCRDHLVSRGKLADDWIKLLTWVFALLNEQPCHMLHIWLFFMSNEEPPPAPLSPGTSGIPKRRKRGILVV